jgi:hypothetical protein
MRATLRLPIELVPSPLWGKSLASQMQRRQWDVIRRSVYARAGGYCEICHNQSQRLLCHEVWDYDDERRVARLAGLVAICPACNLSTHIGRAQRMGIWDEARNHLVGARHGRRQRQPWPGSQLRKWRHSQAQQFLRAVAGNWTCDQAPAWSRNGHISQPRACCASSSWA